MGLARMRGRRTGLARVLGLVYGIASARSAWRPTAPLARPKRRRSPQTRFARGGTKVISTETRNHSSHEPQPPWHSPATTSRHVSSGEAPAEQERQPRQSGGAGGSSPRTIKTVRGVQGGRPLLRDHVPSCDTAAGKPIRGSRAIRGAQGGRPPAQSSCPPAQSTRAAGTMVLRERRNNRLAAALCGHRIGAKVPWPRVTSRTWSTLSSDTYSGNGRQRGLRH
jgi:hypothetical protein